MPTMRTVLALALTVLAVQLAGADHLVVGNTANRVVQVHHETVEYNAIPFMKRVKNFFYTSPNNRPIAGIQALDNWHSKSSVNVTAGGVGYPFVNLRLKSERGRGMSYDVGIYSADLV